MTHDPAAVAAYVAGELTGDPHAEFEQHVLACEDCWKEVELGRRGRQLAALAREPAPPQLRQRIATVQLAGTPRRWPRLSKLAGTPRRWPRLSKLAIAAAAACLAALAAVAAVAALAARDTPPAAVSAAIAEFRAGRLPATGTPSTAAPDLTTMGYTQTAAGTGDLGGVPVSAYAYRDATGRRLLLYLGQKPFATPREAEHYEGSDAWITEKPGVTVLCSRHPHATLVVGQDEEQVIDAAKYLDLT